MLTEWIFVAWTPKEWYSGAERDGSGSRKLFRGGLPGLVVGFPS